MSNDPWALPSGPPVQVPSGPAAPPPPYPVLPHPAAAYPAGPYPAGPPWPAVTPRPGLATWGRRVAAFTVDGFIQLAGPVVAYTMAVPVLLASDQDPDLVGLAVAALLLALVVGYGWSIGWWIFDRVVRQGRTGQSVGKRVLGIRLVTAHHLTPVGPGLAVGRELSHLLDSYSMMLGYLWPLWDARAQTFADKVCGTVVVRAPAPPPQPGPRGTSATWVRRALALVGDLVVPVLCLAVPVTAGVATAGPYSSTGMSTAGLVGVSAGIGLALGFDVWNRVVWQGRTGASLGKVALGLRLVRGDADVPVGPWVALGREVAHLLDVCSVVGWLWPLWDPQQQTFADKLASTRVVRAV